MATKGIGFIKKLCHEKPDIAGGLVLVGISLIGLAYHSVVYDKDTYHQHRFDYTVIREEDANPRLQSKKVYN